VRSLIADRRTVALVALAVAGVLVGLALLGRSERSRWVQAQVHGQQRIVRLVGPLDQRSLIGYRVLPQFDCLVYRRGAELLALELCVDKQGKVVEAIDRRGGARRYYDLESDPGAATIQLDRGEIDRLLKKMGAE
jgi:hypothetical protein